MGLGWSAAIGSGLVVARQEGGGWSPPSALSMYALGWGFQAGGALCDLLLVLHTKCALVLLERAGLNRQCTCCAAGRALQLNHLMSIALAVWCLYMCLGSAAGQWSVWRRRVCPAKPAVPSGACSSSATSQLQL